MQRGCKEDNCQGMVIGNVTYNLITTVFLEAKWKNVCRNEILYYLCIRNCVQGISPLAPCTGCWPIRLSVRTQDFHS